VNQSNFDLQKELEKAAHFSPKFPLLNYEAFKEVIHQFVYG
jgi:hypothetical protein